MGLTKQKTQVPVETSCWPSTGQALIAMITHSIFVTALYWANTALLHDYTLVQRSTFVTGFSFFTAVCTTV